MQSKSPEGNRLGDFQAPQLADVDFLAHYLFGGQRDGIG